jgi:hypothetical protein
MIPGDSRDSVTGCALQPNDYYENSGVWIDRLAEQHAESIRQEGLSEQGIQVKCDEVKQYFETFLQSFPPFIGLLLKRPVVFFVASDSLSYRRLDFRTRPVTHAAAPPANHAGIIHIAEAVLADSMAKKIVAFVHISMRIRIDLAPGGSSGDILFRGFLSVQEPGYLPLQRNLTPRSIGVLWRRRHEVRALLKPILAFGSVHGTVLGSLVKRKDETKPT